MKSTYKICHNWKHVQGHIATSEFKNKVESESEENAIIKFKEENPELGQYIKKDDVFNYWYYGTRSLFQAKEDNIVYAIKI